MDEARMGLPCTECLQEFLAAGFPRLAAGTGGLFM